MKAYIFLLSAFLIPIFSIGQSTKDTPSGGGQYIHEQKDQCLSPEDRQQISEVLYEQRQELIKKGVIKPSQYRVVDGGFQWPVAPIHGLNYNNSWAISNFVDHDASSGIQDYNCDARSYDGHRGTDIFTWPFDWYLVDNNLVNAVAAADGVIISKSDGNDDDHCSCFGTWNAVYIEHSDGSIAWYGHLKKNSLTAKAVGSTVQQGEYLGVIASSGCSTGPHLHFEVYSTTPYIPANLIDPFAGACNPLNSESWWASQIANREPTINAVFTHNAPPVLGCPSVNESPNFDNEFIPGETLYQAFYFKDQLASTTAQYRLRRPDNSVFASWSQTFNNTYSASYWYWTRTVPAGPYGTWQLEVDYNGESHAHQFQILASPSVSETVDGVGINISDPKSALHIHNGAVYIDNPTAGMIMKSNNGNCYRLTINQNGDLVHSLMENCPE